MILYGSTLSPFVRKTLAFASEKGLTLEVKPAGMGRGGPEFEEASPFAKMPGFRDPGADDGADFRFRIRRRSCSIWRRNIPSRT